VGRVLILDGHSAAALAFTRSLGRAGHWVAVGYNRGIFASAALSRYCKLSFEHPVSTDDTNAFADSVVEFARQNTIELIVPITDWTTLPLAHCQTRFENICPVVLPSRQSLEWASDKYQTIELARSVGIPVPQTWLIRSPQDVSALPPLPFPIVVKDRFSVRWVEERPVFGSVEYAYSRESLVQKAQARLEKAGDVLVQRFVGGVGIGFSCFALDDGIRLPFQWQRIREVDPRGSGSSSRKSVALDPQIADFSRALITKLRFQGIAMVEYKREAATGDPVLMEVNGRPWGSIQLAIASGIDYPRYVADWYLKGAIPTAEITYAKGITCRRMVGELTHLENLRHGPPPEWPMPYPKFWSSLVKIAVPWYPGMRYDDLWLSDPRPGMAGIRNWFAMRLRKR
jgi:predicted ATP-grasp superfamily ATP-dependent carboligase